MQLEGDERLLHFPQEVFEHATDHMDVLDLVELGRSFAFQEAVL